jgi:hypothetical protein
MIPLFELSKLHAEMADEVEQAWQQVRQAGAFVGGEFVERFEAEWADYCGARHCIGVANGTDALELCLTALGIGRGDEVIVPANTFIATAEAVANVGAGLCRRRSRDARDDRRRRRSRDHAPHGGGDRGASVRPACGHGRDPSGRFRSRHPGA